ncbi:MAG TPA: TonB-dependent receptor [Gemmatimonadales bacterium]
MTVLAYLCLLPMGELLAQRQALLVGIVGDTARQPLRDVEIIAIRAKLTAVTDSRGIFGLVLPPGDETFLVRKIGFSPQTFQATLVAGDTIRLGIMLGPAPTLLPDLVVVVDNIPFRGKMVDFANRLLTSGAPRSSFLTRADIDNLNSVRLVDHLVRTGLKLRRDRRGREYVECSRGRASLRSAPKVAFYIDGARVQDELDVNSIEMGAVQAIEVYKSAAERPTQFNAPDSDCTVVIWLKD